MVENFWDTIDEIIYKKSDWIECHAAQSKANNLAHCWLQDSLQLIS